MLFPSIPFFFYFLPAALLLYWISPVAFRNPLLLLVSLTFYAWGEPLFLPPMIFLILVNYLLGRKLDLADDQYKRMIVAVTVVLNVAVLLFVVYFDYLAYAVANWLALAPSFHVPRPLGIAFFTLQAMTYVFDVARGKVRPDKSIVNVGLFIAFFPTVLFGPIVRYADLAEQIKNRRTTIELFGAGWERCVVGTAKLVVLALPLSDVAAGIFANSAIHSQVGGTSVVLAWFGILAFCLQFYLAFSGCSDLAIGLARMFGFTLEENFNYPYTAHSVSDFWNRWHISLYRWFFVYVFIAMGGRRPKKVQIRKVTRLRNFALRNYFVLWMLIALWHGISWNTLAFGVWFFLFTFIEWLISLQRRRTSTWRSSIYVLPVVAIGWVFLGSDHISDSIVYISNLLGLNGNGLYGDMVGVYAREYWHIILLSILASTPIMSRILAWTERRKSGVVRYVSAICHVLVMLGLIYLCCIYANELPVVPLIRFN